MARTDPAFEPVARAIWDPANGAQGVFAMMNGWGTINPFVRPAIVRAVEAGTRAEHLSPEVRNGILKLGGRAWLQHEPRSVH